MDADAKFTLSKEERLHGVRLTSRLFSGSEAHSMTVFPLRAVWLLIPRQPREVPAKMMVSVSKRHFKHAIDRNRAKRQVREAYRKHKQLLWEAMREKEDKTLFVAFIWQGDKPLSSAYVEEKATRLLQKLSERI